MAGTNERLTPRFAARIAIQLLCATYAASATLTCYVFGGFMGHGYYVLDAIKDYEARCAEFSDKCAQVLNGEVKAYYTRHKITDSFWLLAAFCKSGDAYLDCMIWRASYRGKTQGKRIGKMPLADAVIAFPELKKAVWLDHWPELTRD